MKPRPYNFGYIIQNEETLTNYQRVEQSDGRVVSGSYRVNLPDGRVQIVSYRASPETGNVVDVRYEGEARYPEYIPQTVKKTPDLPVYNKAREDPAPVKAKPTAAALQVQVPAVAAIISEPVKASVEVPIANPIDDSTAAPVKIPALVEAIEAPVVVPIVSAPAGPAATSIKRKRKIIRKVPIVEPVIEPLPIPAVFRQRPVKFGTKI